MADLSSLGRDTAQFIDSAKAAANTVQANNQGTQESLRRVAADETRIGDINSQMIALEAAARSKTQQAKAEATQAFGVDLTAQSEVITALARRATESKANLDRIGQEISAASSVSLFDNPFAWFVNQFKLDSLKGAFDAEHQLNVTSHQEIQNRQAAASNQAKIQADLLAVVTPEQTALLQEKATIDGSKAAEEARLKAFAANSKAATDALQISNMALNEAYSLQSAKNQAAQLGLARAAARRAEEEFKWNKEKFEILRADKKLHDDKTKKDYEQTRNIINAGRAILNMPALDDDGIDLAVKSISTAGEKSPYWLSYSQGIRSIASGQANMADSPGEYIDVVSNQGFMVKPTGAKAAVHNIIVDQAYATVTRLAAEPPGKNGANPYSGLSYKKDPESFKAAVTAETNKLLQQQMNKVVPDSGNVFDVGPLANIIKMSPHAGSLSVVQQLFAERVAAGDELASHSRNFTTIVDAFKKGEITVEQIIEFSALYKRAAQVNGQAKQFNAYGLNIPPAALKFNVEVETNPNAVFGGKSVVDFTDATALKKAVIKAAASSRSSSLAGILDPLFKPLEQGNQLGNVIKDK